LWLHYTCIGIFECSSHICLGLYKYRKGPPLCTKEHKEPQITIITTKYMYNAITIFKLLRGECYWTKRDNSDRITGRFFCCFFFLSYTFSGVGTGRGNCDCIIHVLVYLSALVIFVWVSINTAKDLLCAQRSTKNHKSRLLPQGAF
jgi:hypothetical protein